MFKNIFLFFGLVVCVPVHAIMVIGIAGGSASGKTTLARKLKEQLGDQLTLIEMDTYYFDMSDMPEDEKRKIDFDNPKWIDFETLRDDLLKLKDGISIQRRHYDILTLKITQADEIAPAKVILVEGFLLLVDPRIRELLDVKIFIDADDDIRLLRRLYRDQVQYGLTNADTLFQWHNSVRPNHISFIAPSKQYADIVIAGNQGTDVALQMLLLFIQAHLQ